HRGAHTLSRAGAGWGHPRSAGSLLRTVTEKSHAIGSLSTGSVGCSPPCGSFRAFFRRSLARPWRDICSNGRRPTKKDDGAIQAWRLLEKAVKVAILAGGVGSRLSEETEIKPKPMVEVGGKPILWHIMKHYARYGFKDFVIALGYKGEHIKRYFVDYCSLSANLRLCFRDGEVHSTGGSVEDWTVELIDTGLNTNTGGRIKRLAPYI